MHASRRKSSQVVAGRCHSTTTYLKPAETKVTDLHIARGRHEHVARLQVAVEHAGRMNVLEGPQNLVHDVPRVLGRDGLRTLQHLVQVGLHQIVDDVEVVEARQRRGREHVAEGHDVLVTAEGPENPQLDERPPRVLRVLEDLGDFLDRAALRVGTGGWVGGRWCG